MSESHDSAADPLAARRAAARDNLSRLGISAAQWARRNGFRHQAVYKVLNGPSKCLFGKQHEIAVKLGIKDGVVAGADHHG